jgi:hypothetical protein
MIDVIKNILNEGLNLPKRGELRTDKLKRFTQTIRQDIIDNVSNKFRGSITNNGSIFHFYDSCRFGTTLSIELRFNLNKGPESINLKFGGYRQAFMPLEQAKDLMEEYQIKLQMYYQIADFIADNFHTYQYDYNDVKLGRVDKNEENI